jgi:ABC-type oligopeptide transport system substrate-binding subunit/DNA-binding SARP family transcriptional activator
MYRLNIRLLGSFQIWRGDDWIALRDWPTRKALELFKILVNGRGHILTREFLMEMVWPNLQPVSAANSLRVSISQIRRLLEPDRTVSSEQSFLQTHHRGYRFSPGPSCWIDVDIFQTAVGHGQQAERAGDWLAAIRAYQTAEEIYRGDYLEENPYDEWAITERERLRQIYFEALSRLGDCFSRQGFYRQALSACRKILQVEPLQESVYRQVMLYHYNLGERDLALQTYERCRQLLANELGIDPMPETRKLHLDILREAAIDPWTKPPVPDSRQQTGESLTTRLALVGRQGELDRIKRNFQAAMSGESRFVLLAGEAGMGKTRLAEEFLAQATEQGGLVLAGSAYPSESRLPYEPVRAALRRALIYQLDVPRAYDLLGPYAAEITILLPELRQALPEIPDSPAQPAELAEARLLAGLTGLIASLAENRPLVIFLDDLQWADSATLRLLGYLSHSPAVKKVLIFGAYSPEELADGSPLEALVGSLARTGHLEEIELENLTIDDLHKLVLDCFENSAEIESFVEILHQETEGYPLLLHETLNGLVAGGVISIGAGGKWKLARAFKPEQAHVALPDRLRKLIEQRIKTLGEPACRLLSAAALVGRNFSTELLQPVVELEDRAFIENLEDLIKRRLIQEHINLEQISYSFNHDRVREVVSDRLSATKRKQLHAKIAASLEAQYAGRLGEIAARIAHHYMEAGLPARSADYLVLAGDWARSLHAHPEAIQHYQRASELLITLGDDRRTGQTLMKIGQLSLTTFEFETAHQAFDESVSYWQRSLLLAVPPQRLTPVPRALRLACNRIQTFDPGKAVDADTIEVISQLYSGLIERTPEMDLVPDIALHWEIREGGRQYRFHLRPEARWSDGAPVKAQDFVNAWLRLLSTNGEQQVGGELLAIKGSRAYQKGETREAKDVGLSTPDDFTLVVELERPADYFLHFLSSYFAYPIPTHRLQAAGDAWSNPETLVTNGPFLFARSNAETGAVFCRNPGYHGQFSGNLDQVELVYEAEMTDRLNRYDEDCLDSLFLWDSPHELDRARQAHPHDYLSAPSTRLSFLGFNQHRPPFDDLRLRQAFAMAIDRRRFAYEHLRGYGEPATGGYIPPGVPGHSPGIGLAFDPLAAGRLLTEAGYPAGRGLPPITGLAGKSQEFLQRQWRENLNVDVNWVALEWVDFANRLTHDLPEIFLLGFGASYPAPDAYLRTGMEWPATGWRCETYDHLLEQVSCSTDHEQRLALCRQADRILVEHVARLPLYYGRWHLLVKPWVSRFPLSPVRKWFWKEIVLEAHA